MANDIITFACRSCHKLLDMPTKCGGTKASCPLCHSITPVPMQTPQDLQLCEDEEFELCEDPSVHLEMGVPGGITLESEVSRSDAGKLAFTLLGGLIAIAAALVGI